MKAINFLYKHLPFILFTLFVVGFLVLAFPRHGGAVLDVAIEGIKPWLEPVRKLLFK